MTKAVELIQNAIAQVNTTLPTDRVILADADTVILGPNAALDSLSVTSIFFEIEAAMSTRGTAVDLFTAPFLLTPDTNTSLTDIATWLDAQASAQSTA